MSYTHSSRRSNPVKTSLSLIAAAIGIAFGGAAFAQAGTVQRDVNQQQRIEQGLQSGQLTTREAGKLERGQARDSALQARAGADGNVDAREQNRIQKNENRQSRRIHREKHDAQTK